MAKRQTSGLLEELANLPRKCRRNWFDGLTSEQQDEVREAVEAMRSGALEVATVAAARTVIKRYGVKASERSVREWFYSRLSETNDG